MQNILRDRLKTVLAATKDSTNMTHYIDTRKLISDIQMRPALWNRNYAVNKAFTEDTWDELAEVHSLPSK